ncbi:MAG: hypothetical protein LC777_03810 [Actinobacteria bacterium]|nr:hypothetical protein [Actinomycetota bacterium]
MPKLAHSQGDDQARVLDGVAPSRATVGLEFGEKLLRRATGALMPRQPAAAHRHHQPLANDAVDRGLIAEEVGRERHARDAREAGSQEDHRLRS